MNNEFYHEFVPGFNWYYVAFFTILVVMFLIGTTKYQLNRTTGKIRIKDPEDETMAKCAIGMSVLFCIMMLFESAVGLLQFALNFIGDSDVAWAVIVVAMIILFIGIGVHAVFYFLGKCGGWAKYLYLDYERKKLSKIPR